MAGIGTVVRSRQLPRPASRTLAMPDITAEGLRTITYGLVCLLVFTVPWQGVIRLGGETTIAKAVGVLAAAAAAASVAISGRRHRLPDAAVMTIVFACWVALSFIWSDYTSLTHQRVITFAQLALLVLIVTEFVRTDARLRGLMVSWVLGAAVVGGTVLFNAARGVKEVRYTASGTNPNDLAFVLLLALPIAWYLSLRTRHSWLVFAYRVYTLLAIFALVLTASRAAVLTLPLALLLVPLTARALKPVWRGAIVVTLLVGAAVGPLLVPTGALNRLSTTSSELSNGTLDHRTTLWKIAADTIGENPVLGVGAGGSRAIVAKTFPTEKGVQNSYLSVGADLGMIGLVLFGLVLLAAIWRASHAPWLERRFALTLWLTLLAALVPRHGEYDKSVWTMVALLALVGTVRFPRRRAAPPGYG